MFALPTASCGLRLDDEAVRVAVGLRLESDLCVPHQCHCGSQVDARGLHSFVCKRAPGRSARHITLLTTWWPVGLLQPEFLSPKRRSGYSVGLRLGLDLKRSLVYIEAVM